MKIYIFGSKGMLGCYLQKYLTTDHQVIPLARDNFDITKCVFFDYLNFFKKNNLKENDVIINAAGIIKQKKFDLKDLVLVNSYFPHILADIKSIFGCNVIHVTTDCVFSGNKGNYEETDHHDCFDEYGKSKSLGENPNLTSIRTSIIGEENYSKKSLLEWVKSKKNQKVFGYTNHLWNGITCLEFAKICDLIIRQNKYWSGVKHIYSPDTVSKYELIQNISAIYELNLEIEKKSTEICCFRNLKTNQNFKPVEKSILEQIIELKSFSISS